VTDQPTTPRRAWKTAQWITLAIIFVILFAVVCGGLPAAREKARRANCLSNLHCCTLAFAMYADEYQGRCPVDEHVTLIGSYRLLSNFVTSARTYFCPSDMRPGARFQMDYAKLTTRNVSYSYVPNLMWNDGRTNMILWLDRIDTTERGSKWLADSNHGRAGGNVAFKDGHAGFFAELPCPLQDKDGNLVVLSP